MEENNYINQNNESNQIQIISTFLIIIQKFINFYDKYLSDIILLILNFILIKLFGVVIGNILLLIYITLKILKNFLKSFIINNFMKIMNELFKIILKEGAKPNSEIFPSLKKLLIELEFIPEINENNNQNDNNINTL